MFSVSPAEIATITLVALLVFGPHRLPEMAQRIGRIVRDIGKAAHELKSGLEREIEETKSPLDDVRRRLGATITEAIDEPQDADRAEAPEPPGDDSEEESG